MTVQELIDELMKVEDKTRQVRIFENFFRVNYIRVYKVYKDMCYGKPSVVIMPGSEYPH